MRRLRPIFDLPSSAAALPRCVHRFTAHPGDRQRERFVAGTVVAVSSPEVADVVLSSNLVFSKWDQIFKDPMTTMAAVDRLVHHAIILEFVGETLRGPRENEKAKG